MRPAGGRPRRRFTINPGWLFVLPALAVLAVSVIIPIMAVVNYSVQDVFAGNNFFWAGSIWFEKTLRSPEFQATLLRSGAFSALVLMIEVPLGIYIALRMPRSGPLATTYLVMMAIPLLIPWFVVGLIWKSLADTHVGLYGVPLALLTQAYDLNNPVVAWIVVLLVDVWHWTSLVVLLCYAGLVAIPNAAYQAARIDGASRWAIFRYIELPGLQRVLLIVVLIRLMDSLMVYIEPFMITRGGPGVSTTFLSLDLIQTAMIQFDFGEASAMALVYFLITLSISWVLYKIMMSRTS